MWVIAGGNDSQFYNDVWFLLRWGDLDPGPANAGFNPRINPGAAAYNGQSGWWAGQNYAAVWMMMFGPPPMG